MKTIAEIVSDSEHSALVKITSVSGEGSEELVWHFHLPKSSTSLNQPSSSSSSGCPAVFATVSAVKKVNKDSEEKPALLQVVNNYTCDDKDDLDFKTTEYVLCKAPTTTLEFKAVLHEEYQKSQPGIAFSKIAPDNWIEHVVSSPIKSEDVTCKLCYTEVGPFYRLSSCPVKPDHTTELHLMCRDCKAKQEKKLYKSDPSPQIKCPFCMTEQPSRWMVKYRHLPPPENSTVQIIARKNTFENRKAEYMKSKIPPKVYPCRWCNLQFLSESTRRYHHKTHISLPVCKICKKEGCKLCEFKLKRTCDFCDKLFATPKNLRAHKEGARYKCQVCNYCQKFFKKKHALKKHKCPMYPNFISPTPPVKTYERKQKTL